MSGRGRGKRATAATKENAAAAATAENTATTENTVNNVVVDKPAKKVSKKKQFPVVAVITPDGIQGNLQPEIKRPLIVHLPIQSKDVTFNDVPVTYDPTPPQAPEPYVSFDPFSDIAEQLPENNTLLHPVVNEPIEHTNDNVISNTPGTANTSSSHTNTTTETIDFYNIKDTLLVQYKDSSDMKAIPAKSDSACFWCCHTFNNRPVVLPLRDQGKYLQVFGNFCCPECATAYLFDMRQDSHTRWEQLALLYRLYSDACGGKLHPAPSKNALKLFGGSLTIEDYRSLIRSYKVRIDVHLPPMVSLLATMDTKPIDFYDSSLTKNVSETVKERLQKAEEVLRLKRTKPLKAWESTLDACINLKIKSDESKMHF
jgi:hypothetical protein